VTMALEKMEDEHEILLNDDCIYMAWSRWPNLYPVNTVSFLD
jgi:hypothetical protein